MKRKKFSCFVSLESLYRDLRYACRQIGKAPVFLRYQYAALEPARNKPM